MSYWPPGPKSARWLAEAGIDSLDDLRAVGAVAAYARVKAIHPREASLNLLWALQGALEGKPWHAVDKATKERLKAELTDTSR